MSREPSSCLTFRTSRLNMARTKSDNGNVIHIRYLKTKEVSYMFQIWVRTASGYFAARGWSWESAAGCSVLPGQVHDTLCSHLMARYPQTIPTHTNMPKLTIVPERIMYVLGELSHTVVAFDLSTGPAENIQPIDDFAPSVVPPSAHPDYHLTMDSAEICLHPQIPNVLYVSNRWERHLALQLGNKSTKLPPGDAIAIILLSPDGKRVEETKFSRTNLNTIRGMRLSSDGSLVALVGQEGGGIEIYSISGERGDEWTLAASLNEGLESGIKHVVWL